MKLIAFLIVLIIGIASCMYSVFFGKIHHVLDYDNEKHIGRFSIFFFVFLIVSVLLAFLPVTIWPLPVMVLCIALFSNQVTGILTAGIFTTVSTMASGQSVYVFALYLSVCVVTVLIFHGIDESVKLGLPIFIDLSAIAVIEMTFLFLTCGTNFVMDYVILAIVNIVLCGLLEIIVLKVFCTTVIFRNRDRYLVINDTEFPVMKDAKEAKKDVYMHAVHTAYLSDKLAEELNINTPKIKTASFYARIGEAFVENPDDAYYENLCKEKSFPKDATDLMLELRRGKKKIYSKEACVVMMADAMISSVIDLFKKDKESKPDYDSMIDRMIMQKIDDHILDECDISVKDLNMIQKTLLKETLYYDFLR